MAGSNDKSTFIGRPIPKAYSFDEKEAPQPNNPAVRGLIVYIGAHLVSNLPLVQNIIWANAGFSRLRNRPEIADVVPRFDPTVIKTDGQLAQSKKDGSSGDPLAELLSEDFDSRLPRGKGFPSSLDYHEAYKSGKLTPSAVVEALLPLIRRDVDGASPHSTAFLETKVELVRRAAEESTLRYKKGKPLSPLDGVPVAVKDEVDLTGYKRSCGSKLDFTAKEPATSYCVAQWEAAGAVVVGKTNMHEIGMDTTTCNPNHGTPLNPYNKDYYCGGSSGGSAYAVAAGLMPVALGADGGGSIRIPSAYCGLFGLKPSHGRVSGRPTYCLASSTCVYGPMAANMLDLELSYRIMAQPDALDPTASQFSPPIPTTKLHGRKRVLGIDRRSFNRADAPVRAACQKAIDWLVAEQGYELVDESLPLLPEAQLAHAITILSEVSSGLAAEDISQLSAPNRILLSAVSGPTRAVDLLQAQKVRNLVMKHLSHLFTTHPGLVLVSPTTPNAGWRIHPGDLKYGVSDGNMSLRAMTYAPLANFAGNPAITVPVDYVAVEKGGVIPVGLMGMADWCADDELIAFGYDCERFLHEGLEGGRRLPENWVDVFKAAGKS